MKTTLLMPALLLIQCQAPEPSSTAGHSENPQPETPDPQYTLTSDQTHNKFSSTIEPVLTVPSAVQGLGEVCGTAIEAPMRIVYEIELIKGRSIPEPQYENDSYYAVTAYGTSLDVAARKATSYMIDHLAQEKGLSREDAYMICSLAGDLHIAEVVDVPHVLVAMHMPKEIFNRLH